MRQVVYDTQTLIRGLVDPRDPYSTLFFLPSEWKLCLSDVILREALETLLGPSGLQATIPRLSEISLAEAYGHLQSGNVYQVPGDIEIEICQDPHDNKFLASALAMDCDVLVTEIPELLDLERNSEWQEFKRTNSVRVAITDPESFVRMVGGG